MYYMKRIKNVYLIINEDTEKAVASFNLFDNALNLLNILDDLEAENEFLKEGKV